jgi:hypothetical protein
MLKVSSSLVSILFKYIIVCAHTHANIFTTKCSCYIKKVKDIPVTGRGGPLGLREVETPTLLRQTANRWRQGCQPYAPAALYPHVSFFLSFFFFSPFF